MSIRFKSATPISEVVDWCASRSKIWTQFLDDKGCACTIGEMGKAALGLKTLKQDEYIVGSLFDSESAIKRARWDRIISRTSGPDKPFMRRYWEEDNLPKGFVPYQKRAKVLNSLKKFLGKETPTFGDFRRKLKQRLKEQKLKEAEQKLKEAMSAYGSGL